MKNSYCPNCKSKISFLNLLFNTSNRCPNCNSNLKIYFLGEIILILSLLVPSHILLKKSLLLQLLLWIFFCIFILQPLIQVFSNKQ